MTTATNDVRSLLVELVCEELPPKALKKLGESFATTLVASLKAAGLAGEAAVATGFASPRRLGVHVTGVAAKAADRALLQKLMPASVAFDTEGAPTPALLKKLQSLGFGADAVPGLKRQPDGKAESLFVDQMMAERQAIVEGKHVFAGPLSDLEGKQRVAAGAVLSDGDLWKMDWYVPGVITLRR